MKANFSEFSFGYALTDDLVNRYRNLLSAAPRFPSLLEEGRDQGGYDVKFDTQGHFLFLQFKLSDCMLRRSATQWHHYGEEYFRFALMSTRHSRQHELLLSLEAQFSLVFYAAPVFYLVDDLNENFLNNSIASKTTFIMPSLVGSLPDENQHHITFDRHGQHPTFWSEPRALEGHAFGAEFMEQVASMTRNRESQTMNDESFTLLSNSLKAILSEKAAISPDVARRLEMLLTGPRYLYHSR